MYKLKRKVMRKILTLSVLLLGLTTFNSCTPESVEELDYEITEEATDKDKNGTVGNQGGNDPDEDHN